MPTVAPNPMRWTRNDDGSYSRTVNGVQETSSDYSILSKEELASELESRGLTKSGNKDELIARLQENDGEGDS